MNLRQNNFAKRNMKCLQYSKNSFNKINAKIDCIQRVGVLRLYLKRKTSALNLQQLCIFSTNY